MTRTPIAFSVDDISALAKSLRKQCEGRDTLPGHVELLNMLARSAGHQNFQQFRSLAAPSQPAAEAPRPAPIGPDLALVERVLRHFDGDGRLIRWPARRSQQLLCLWALWAAFPARESLDDSDVKALLARRHSFADHALLRRELVDMGLLARTADGRDYRRIEREPPADARALIRALSARSIA